MNDPDQFLTRALARLDLQWQVIDAATKLCGNTESAVHWYYDCKIIDLGHLSAHELVEAGRGACVLAYIESLSAGASG
jgi:hypothetical protein